MNEPSLEPIKEFLDLNQIPFTELKTLRNHYLVIDEIKYVVSNKYVPEDWEILPYGQAIIFSKDSEKEYNIVTNKILKLYQDRERHQEDINIDFIIHPILETEQKN